MRKQLTSFSGSKKYLKKKNIKKKNFSLGAFFRTFLASIIIISLFSVSPIVFELTKKTSFFSKDFENNSKNNLKKLLKKKDHKLDKAIDQSFLFEDILMFDDKSTDSIRLSAATIEELFKSTNYNLKDVRKNKLVKPISLTLLPKRW